MKVETAYLLLEQGVSLPRKNIIPTFKKIKSRCFHQWLNGSDTQEVEIYPKKEFGEIRLYEMVQGEELYSTYLKIGDPPQDKNYLVVENYLILQSLNYQSCFTIYELG